MPKLKKYIYIYWISVTVIPLSELINKEDKKSKFYFKLKIQSTF